VDRPCARSSVDLRCAYCHDDAEGAHECAGCGTLTHPGCRAEAGGCVTLGCVPTALCVERGPPAGPLLPWSELLCAGVAALGLGLGLGVVILTDTIVARREARQDSVDR
jgi:hypothetical protein